MSIPNEKDLATYETPENPNEHCWETGEFGDDCDCELCDHRFGCSGYERDDWEE